MSETKLHLDPRTISGKKVKNLRSEGLIPSVVYGGQAEPILTSSPYNETEVALREVGYHSTLDLDLNGETKMAIVKAIDLDPATRRIVNVEFQAVSADKPVEATTPIVITGFDESEAARLHYVLMQVMEEIDVKAKPADLPKQITADAKAFTSLDNRVLVKDLILPSGVELADKELDPEQVVASVYDPAAEAAARAAEEEAAKAAAAESAEGAESGDAGDSDAKTEEASAEEK